MRCWPAPCTTRPSSWPTGCPTARCSSTRRGAPVVGRRPDGRALTYLERDGTRLAVLVHDTALADEPELVAGGRRGRGHGHGERAAAGRDPGPAARGAGVAGAHRRGRRRGAPPVERDLHDGAQQRLVSVVLALKLARSRLATAPPEEVAALLDEAGAELSGALDELRELARGIYPVLLTDAGLGPALAALALRSPVPATVVAVAPEQRLPGPVEQAAYFVVSEALANAAKHADARRGADRGAAGWRPCGRRRGRGRRPGRRGPGRLGAAWAGRPGRPPPVDGSRCRARPAAARGCGRGCRYPPDRRVAGPAGTARRGHCRCVPWCTGRLAHARAQPVCAGCASAGSRTPVGVAHPGWCPRMRHGSCASSNWHA